MSQISYNNTPTLYLIPTPIGNLDDITLRAIHVLKEVEVVFSEDTRVTSLLLNHLNIKRGLWLINRTITVICSLLLRMTHISNT